ncbi:unnamed protein product [Tilletia laevis]|uniref:Uncharacterized protein n=2 Tax=Tilletia TaxID=13289 RepID=A0A8X7MW96_9BASI|nr:hypothetical protein CF328_g2134 [Tilletia controversa]CAD6890609.1 unnamed protein product [Tilletia caries]CAD6943737.1 unnamed protein product [Tilletia laevis]KAE8251651.1 hypothetical protein A4X06_0g2592 [Tilletia controversa]CAD6948349.1 unnamed protein product [Tilletia caries]
MLDEPETVSRDQERLEERSNRDPGTASYEDRVEELNLKYEELSYHFTVVQDSKDRCDCLRGRQDRCDYHFWVEPHEESEDVRNDVISVGFELERLTLDWSAHLVSQLADPSTRTVQTCSKVLDGVLGMIKAWGHTIEHDYSKGGIEWPDKEPWPKPGENEEDDVEDIPAVICRVWRDLLLCILAIEHDVPASDSATRPTVTALRQRALAHLNIPVASRLPPRGGVLGVLVHDQKSSRQMPKWHDAAIKEQYLPLRKILQRMA